MFCVLVMMKLGESKRLFTVAFESYKAWWDAVGERDTNAMKRCIDSECKK